MSKYSGNDLNTLLLSAGNKVAVLRAAGYDAYIVGGVLRAVMYDGSTSDADIAILINSCSEEMALHKDMSILFQADHFVLQHGAQGASEYTENRGFLADWRSANTDVNVIAYHRGVYPNINDLVAAFDYNINSWYLDPHKNPVNPMVNGRDRNQVVKVNPLRDPIYQEKRAAERLARFRADLPKLDWSNV